MSNKALCSRVANPSDEYYTTRDSIEKEFKNWPDIFRGKRVCCPCDSEDSEFVKFFRDNAARLELRSFEHFGYNYKKNRWELGIMFGPASYWLQESYNDKPDGVCDIQKGMIASCDIVVTNPPFSLLVQFYEVIREKTFIIVAPLAGISRVGIREDIGYIYSGYTKPDCYGPKSVSGSLIWLQNISPIYREDVPFKNERFEPEGYNIFGLANFNSTRGAPRNYSAPFCVPLSAFEKLGNPSVEVVGILPDRGRRLTDGSKTFARLVVKYKED